MPWTAPRTWVVGEVVTAAIGNTHWRDNLLFLGDDHDHSGDAGDGGAMSFDSGIDTTASGAAGTTVRESTTVVVGATSDVILAVGGARYSTDNAGPKDIHIRDNTDAVNGVTGGHNQFHGHGRCCAAEFTSPTVATHTIELRDDNADTYVSGYLLAWVIPG